MSSADTERLRVLVNDYYHGLVTFDSYRAQRGRLLDNLERTDAAAAPAPVAPAKSVRPEHTQKRASAPPPANVAPSPEPTARRRGALAPAAIAAVVVIAAVAIVAYLQLRPGHGDAPEPTAPAEDAANLPPGEALLERFLQRNAWDADAARTLSVAWTNGLQEADRQSAMASLTHRRFSDVLRRRLREEEALAAGSQSKEHEILVSMARDLGVRYAAVPERDAVRADTPPPRSPAANQSATVTSPTPTTPEPRAAADTPAAAAATPATTPAPVRESPSRATGPQTPAVPAQSTTRAATPAATTTAATADAVTSSACNASLLNTRRPYCTDTLASGGNAPALVIVPAGEFDMGNDQTPNAAPVHHVNIAKPFAMSIHEVSFGEYRLFCTRAAQRCPENPWSDDNYPAVHVSWGEAVRYAQWLSAETGQRYALPSESQWEYAARARTTSLYPFGDNVTPAAAVSSANGPVSAPVPSSDRKVNANAFRLFHMIGNVREWVADAWSVDYGGAPTDGGARAGESGQRVVRGGSYADGGLPLRSAARLALDGTAEDAMTGFRVVREIAP